jgi:ribosomal protein L11 methylase PrmA
LWSAFFPSETAANEALVSQLWELGTTGIIEELEGMRAFFDDAVDRASIALLSINAVIRSEDEILHVAAPVDGGEPLLIGERFFVVPADHPAVTPAGRIRLVMQDSIAFGTGRHESTQLCLQALEGLNVKGCSILDVGSGSGILSAAAHQLGAAQVYSCDIHEDAIHATQVQTDAAFFIGSVDALATASADVVLANISAVVLDILAFDLKRVLKSAGVIVISGFLTERPPQRFTPLTRHTEREWSCWVLSREQIFAPDAPDPAGISHNAQWWL